MLSSTHQFTKRVHNIACLPGDGIGPEVMAEAIKVLKKVEQLGNDLPATSNIKNPGGRFNIIYGKVGGAAYDEYGCHLPQETVRLCDQSDAVLFGSVGGPVDVQMQDPKWMNAERNSLLGLREHLKLGVNLRPATVFPSMSHLSPLKNERIDKGVDVLVVRELLGCVYFGEHKTEGELSRIPPNCFL